MVNNYSFGLDTEDDYLSHHGILGMKWGVRRYQNPDGTLTAAGRKRLGFTQTDRYRKTMSKVLSNPVLYDINKKMVKRAVSTSSKKKKTSILQIRKPTEEEKKKTIADLDKLNDQEFMNKYSVSKDKVRKRFKVGTSTSSTKSTKSTKTTKSRHKSYLERYREKRENYYKLVEANNQRILKEVKEYDKKDPGFYENFISNYDDLDLWDLYSPEELKFWK